MRCGGEIRPAGRGELWQDGLGRDKQRGWGRTERDGAQRNKAGGSEASVAGRRRGQTGAGGMRHGGERRQVGQDGLLEQGGLLWDKWCGWGKTERDEGSKTRRARQAARAARATRRQYGMKYTQHDRSHCTLHCLYLVTDYVVFKIFDFVIAILDIYY